MRLAFGAYVLLLFTATHWPQLRIEGGPIERPDIALHFMAFGSWCLLLCLCAWFGPVASGRNIVISAAIASAYGAVDELTQAIPIFGRTFAWADMGANVAGVVAFASLIALVGWFRRLADTEKR